jgi:hypothetical protein
MTRHGSATLPSRKRQSRGIRSESTGNGNVFDNAASSRHIPRTASWIRLRTLRKRSDDQALQSGAMTHRNSERKHKGPIQYLKDVAWSSGRDVLTRMPRVTQDVSRSEESPCRENMSRICAGNTHTTEVAQSEKCGIDQMRRARSTNDAARSQGASHHRLPSPTEASQ